MSCDAFHPAGNNSDFSALLDTYNIKYFSSGSRISRWGDAEPLGGGGRRPPTWALFGKNICKNERIGFCWGGAPAALPPDPPMYLCNNCTTVEHILRPFKFEPKVMDAVF